MSFKFKFIDHTADIAADLEADSIEELFTAAALAWKESVFENTEIKEAEEKEINFMEADAESLLVKFLGELNFLFQTKKWICSSVKEIKIKKDYEWNLYTVVSGEPYDPAEHVVNLEIKAVTFHQMEIKKVNGRYSTRIVFDI